MSQKYLALTIGPIDKTISKARHTRELWAASYTFSYLMKQICKGIPNKKAVIVPALTDDLFDFQDKDLQKTGVGLFPDRLIMKADDTFTFENFNTLIDEVLTDFAKKVASHLKRSKQEVAILTAFKAYFQLYSLEAESQGNLIETIMPYLDSMELQRNYSLRDNKALNTFFFRVSKSFLVQDGFGTSSKRFDSLVEIATKHFEKERANLNFSQLPEPTELAEEDDLDFVSTEAEDKELLLAYSKDLDKNILELAKQFDPSKKDIEKPFLPCYKYVAVVQADGDNVGTIVKALASQSEEQLVEFSKKLYQFSRDAVKLIDEYGGMNIYAGGDDLLFFAPVRCGDTTIFDLLKLLDEMLQETLKEYKDSKPSLSFGLSIAHFKAPLYETIKDVSYRLFNVAKEAPKNALAFQIEKHSGQQTASKISLNRATYKILQEMLAMKIHVDNVDLRGLTYDIKSKEAELIATKGIGERIDNFFDNNFDELIHKKEGKAFLDKVKELLKESIVEFSTLDAAIEHTHVILRTYLFMTSKELK